MVYFSLLGNALSVVLVIRCVETYDENYFKAFLNNITAYNILIAIFKSNQSNPLNYRSYCFCQTTYKNTYNTPLRLATA